MCVVSKIREETRSLYQYFSHAYAYCFSYIYVLYFLSRRDIGIVFLVQLFMYLLDFDINICTVRLDLISLGSNLIVRRIEADALSRTSLILDPSCVFELFLFSALRRRY